MSTNGYNVQLVWADGWMSPFFAMFADLPETAITATVEKYGLWCPSNGSVGEARIPVVAAHIQPEGEVGRCHRHIAAAVSSRGVEFLRPSRLLRWELRDGAWCYCGLGMWAPSGVPGHPPGTSGHPPGTSGHPPAEQGK